MSQWTHESYEWFKRYAYFIFLGTALGANDLGISTWQYWAIIVPVLVLDEWGRK